MGARKGSNNGSSGGKKGRSGRKSAYQEKADAKTLHKMFFDKQDREKIKSMVKGGKYSIKDSFMAKAFAGSERHQLAIFNKLFPDIITTPDDKDFIVPIIIRKGVPKNSKN